MKIPKRNQELVTSGFRSWINGLTELKNVEITDSGLIARRKGYNTFGEMVHVLWELNKRAKKMGYKSEYTVVLPLKGTKPIYKKTLVETKTP